MSMPRNYGSSTVIARISASSACRLDPAAAEILTRRVSMSLTHWVCGSRRLTLATARRRDVIRDRGTHRSRDIDQADPGSPHALMARPSSMSSRDPCRRWLRVGYTAGCAASNMLPSRYADALSGTASPAPAGAWPRTAGMTARPGGQAVVQRSVHDMASLQYQRTSAHAWPPSGTSRPSGSAMPHMEH